MSDIGERLKKIVVEHLGVEPAAQGHQTNDWAGPMIARLMVESRKWQVAVRRPFQRIVITGNPSPDSIYPTEGKSFKRGIKRDAATFYDVVSIGGGFFAAWVLLDIPPWSLLNDVIRTFGGMDVMVGLVKALIFGTIISVVCLHQGFRAGETMTNVPPQASRALVQCFIFCILVNVLVSAVFYL